jgi:hypothetical protein
MADEFFGRFVTAMAPGETAGTAAETTADAAS